MNDWKLRCGRILMLAAGIGAVGAAMSGLASMDAVTSDRLWIELWRNLGFLVFAGLFGLVAWKPAETPVVWEILFLHKAGLAVAAAILPAVPEAHDAGVVDLGLAIMIVTAWVLTRGWKSWRHAIAR